jgi:flavin-dependent dehydrogenase
MSHFDCVVIGGGPAGSTAAALLSGKGRKVLLLERERFPRFHIGESLMPGTYDTFGKIGMLDRFGKSDFPKKYSVQFFTSKGKPSRPFYFSEFYPLPMAQTWQVERATFDKMLLDRARELGADVREGWNVREAVFEGDRAVGVRAAPLDTRGGEGPAETFRAPVTIDASGQSALLARSLGLIRKDPRLAKAAVFAHYEDGLRDPGIDEGAILVVDTPDGEGWFWYIPLPGSRVSVGVVGNSGDLVKRRPTPEGVLDSEIAGCPTIRRRLESARRVSPVRVLRDFSYRSDRCSGPGWVLIGDAFGFLDPVYSSGVLLAVKGAEFAAEAVDDALRSGDLSGRRLGAFGPGLARGMEAIRKLVYAFYSPDFSFAQFINEHPEHRRGVTDILVGDVFKDGVEDIFRDMKRYCDLPESRPLGEPAEAGRPATRDLETAGEAR